jgi:hypothetical protein
MSVRPGLGPDALPEVLSLGSLSSFSSGNVVAAAFDASAAPKNAAVASIRESGLPGRERSFSMTDGLEGGATACDFAARIAA